MKKLIACLLALTMLVSLAAGCSSSKSSEAAAPTAATAPASAGNETKPAETTSEEAPRYKVGVILYSKEDTLGARMYSLLSFAAEALNIDMIFAVGDFDTPSQLTSAENLISAGCQGILLLPLAETASQKISALCEENGVYLGVMLRSFSDPEINTQVRSNPYFVGNILGDDEGNAKELTRLMIQDFGCKELAMYYSAEGTSMALRNVGMRAALEEFGGHQVAEATSGDASTATITTMVQNFVSLNSGLQGIVLVTGTQGVGECVGNTLTTMNAEGVKYGTFDAYDGMIKNFESGHLQVVCGGQAPLCIYVLSMLYNAMDGHPLTKTGEELRMIYMFIKSAEEAKNFQDYIENNAFCVYTEEEIRNMTVRFNPDFNWEGLQKVMSEYSYESIITKFAK